MDKLAAEPANETARVKLTEYTQRAITKRDKLALNLERAETFIADLHTR